MILHWVLQAVASRAAVSAKESRDELVTRLREEQAGQAAHLESLRQAIQPTDSATTLLICCKTITTKLSIFQTSRSQTVTMRAEAAAPENGC